MESCENRRWWRLTSLGDHPCPFQPRRSWNILTADNKTPLQGPCVGEGPWLHPVCPPSTEAEEGKDPLLHLHRLTANTQGSLPLHLAASKPQELLCCCPNRLKAAVQWPAGPQERVFLTATISYWICAWATPGDGAAQDSRINILFCVQAIPLPYWSSNCNITSSSRHSKTLLSKHQFAHLHRQIFTKQSKTVGFPLHRGTVKHYNKFP